MVTLNRTQVYFNQILEDEELLQKVFNTNQQDYVFRHTDCPIVFTTDGINLYAMDMDEQGVCPIEKYGIEQISCCYNDYNEFLLDISKIENILDRHLYLTSWNNEISQVINENICDSLELQQEQILKQLREVNDEIDLYEEDYRPDLLDKKEELEKNLKIINKQLYNCEKNEN